MRPQTLFLAAALALAPVALAAQDSTATTGSGPDARVDAALEAAMSAGIPVSLLERKIVEGKAKGVPMDRIATAVEARLQALVKAREAMRKGGLESPTEGELSVAADAVQGGVSATALATISRSAPQDRREVAIAILTDLVVLGRSSETALTQVQAALARGPEALANLQGQSTSAAQANTGAGAAGANATGAASVGVGTQIEVGPHRQ